MLNTLKHTWLSTSFNIGYWCQDIILPWEGEIDNIFGQNLEHAGGGDQGRRKGGNRRRKGEGKWSGKLEGTRESSWNKGRDENKERDILIEGAIWG